MQGRDEGLVSPNYGHSEALADRLASQQDQPMPDLIRFRVRPEYHGSQLLLELLDEHRNDGFPNVASILRNSLNAVRIEHPDKLDDPQVAMLQDRYFSFWKYSGGTYEIDDDIWSLFVSAKDNNAAVITDVEDALISTGLFKKEAVDFEQFR